MDTPLFVRVINPIITDQKVRRRVLLPLLWMQSKATLSRGHDQPPQSPEGSLATPAAKSGTSGWSHKVVGCCSHSLPHQIPEMYTAVRILRVAVPEVRQDNKSVLLPGGGLGQSSVPSLCHTSGVGKSVSEPFHAAWLSTTSLALNCVLELKRLLLADAIFFKPAAQLDAFKRGAILCGCCVCFAVHCSTINSTNITCHLTIPVIGFPKYYILRSITAYT